LITVLMRLVFLLYAEDNALLPKDAVYEQNYKVSGVFERLEQDAAEFPDTMQQRYGAWAGLMSLCQLVFAGGGATDDYLPARKGQLFDPAVYPWLETPWISDGVVHEVLSNLLVVKGERISYRALDVEQIGSVYEGIMGYAVRRIPGRCIGLKSKPQGAKKQLTTAVDLDALLALPGAKRKAWLEEQAGTTLPAKSETALKAAASEAELLEALEPRINRELFDGPQPVGSLVFQPTEERRRSGSHYTPRALTRPIVEEALRPWLERCGGKPTVTQILALKICDPAMGSGAFLVECCRYLAELLELAWNREGLPEALKPGGSAHGEEPLIYARRLIAQSCLYGVDKNPFAVNLARLSLWLVSLSKDAPFTFVDHALKCGDSLVGMERSEIEKAFKGASLQREIQMAYLDQVRQQEAKSFATFHADSRSDADDAQKRQALDDLNASTAYLRTVGDLLVAAFFNGKKPKDREELKKLYLEATLQHSSAEELEDELAEPLVRLREGEKGIQPLHWQMAFPDVFIGEKPGFDLILGNPPFLGGGKISTFSGLPYLSWLSENYKPAGHYCDLCAYFFRRSYQLLAKGGVLAMVATNTISEGDTREGGLAPILNANGAIYRAQTQVSWPGIAAVKVSIIHLLKDTEASDCKLNSMNVPRVSAFLKPGSTDSSPRKLARHLYFAQGSKIYGQGFLFDDRDSKASPVAVMDDLISRQPELKSRIFPYMRGEDLTSSPRPSPSAHCIYLSDIKDEAELSRFPELAQIVKQKVKPERDALGSNPVNTPLKIKWWAYQAHRPELYERISGKSKVLAHSNVSKYIAFSFLDPGMIYSMSLILVDVDSDADFGILQSRIHEEWARFLCSTLEDRLRYTPSDCLATFPYPFESPTSPSDAFSAKSMNLETVAYLSTEYYNKRADAMVSTGKGLTALYNDFNDPACQDLRITELRDCHSDLDKSVFNSYGWSDIDGSCGYGLADLDLDEDVQLPSDFQMRIDNGELFFWDSSDALDFQVQLEAYGAISGRRKLPWRFRWPDAVRDDVLARLLALNAERYEEEVAQGLHSKSSKKASGPAAPGAKRRGRPPKSAQAGETGSVQAEQIGLGL
jgi:hypothetical protein